LQRPHRWRHKTRRLWTSKKYVSYMNGQSTAILYDHESIKNLYKLVDYKLKTLFTSSDPTLAQREKLPANTSSFLDIDVRSITFPYRPDDGICKHHWNVAKLVLDEMVQHPRRQPSSSCFHRAYRRKLSFSSEEIRNVSLS
jgi:hypothetical protein